MFIRNFVVNPTSSTNGYPIGGVVGYFKSLQKLCEKVNPSKVIIAWDGVGGSKRRKQQNKEYKNKRKPLKLNRLISASSELDEVKNKVWQQTKLFECLNCLPVVQFLFDNVEADDVIACVCNNRPNDEKVIVSSDKDFIQLCNKTTILYRPTQEEILTENSVIEKYGIHPNNICLARAIAGDRSDNLPGVPGIALKTVIKNLPFLRDKKNYGLEEVLLFCKEANEKSKFFQKIIDFSQIINHNIKLMQLKIPNLCFDTKEKILYTLENVKLEFNKTELNSIMIKDGWGYYNFSSLFRIMNKILISN